MSTDPTGPSAMIVAVADRKTEGLSALAELAEGGPGLVQAVHQTLYCG